MLLQNRFSAPQKSGSKGKCNFTVTTDITAICYIHEFVFICFLPLFSSHSKEIDFNSPIEDFLSESFRCCIYSYKLNFTIRLFMPFSVRIISVKSNNCIVGTVKFLCLEYSSISTFISLNSRVAFPVNASTVAFTLF